MPNPDSARRCRSLFARRLVIGTAVVASAACSVTTPRGEEVSAGVAAGRDDVSQSAPPLDDSTASEAPPAEVLPDGTAAPATDVAGTGPDLPSAGGTTVTSGARRPRQPVPAPPVERPASPRAAPVAE